MNPIPGRRVIVNAALSASTWFLPLVLSFISTPILLSSLGSESYGIYALVMGFVGYSFTFGIGKAAAKFVAEHRAAGSDRLVSESVCVTFWFSLLVGLAGSILIAALAGPFVEKVLLIPEAGAETAKRGLLVAAGIVLFTMISQVWSFTLQGLHRFDKYAVVTAIGSILLNFGSVALAWSGFDVVGILVWNLITTCLIGLSFLVAVRNTESRIGLTANIRRPVRDAVFRYGGAIIFSQVFGNLLLLFERSWIARSLGAEALTHYVVPMTLALFLHAFIGSIVIVLFPIVNERLTAPTQVLRIYRVATKFVLALAAFAVTTVLVFGRQILEAWVGGAIADHSATLLNIHMCTFGLLGSATVAWQVAESFGRASTNVIFSFIWLVVGSVLMLLLGGAYGLEGIAIARLVGCLGTIPLVILVERRVLGSFSGAFWLKAVLRLVAALATSLILQSITSAWVPGLPAVLLGVLVGGTGYSAVLLSLRYFEQEELDWFRRTIQKSTGPLR